MNELRGRNLNDTKCICRKNIIPMQQVNQCSDLNKLFLRADPNQQNRGVIRDTMEKPIFELKKQQLLLCIERAHSAKMKLVERATVLVKVLDLKDKIQHSQPVRKGLGEVT